MKKQEHDSHLIDWRNECLKDIEEKANTFAKIVTPLYKQLEWHWTGRGVPSQKMVRDNIKEQVKELLDNPKAVASGTGGIVVSFSKNDGCAKVEFIVSMLGFPLNCPPKPLPSTPRQSKIRRK